MPPRQAIIGLLLALMLVVLPLAFELPVWVSAVFAASTAWSIRCLRRHLSMPSTVVRGLMVIAALGAVVLAYGTIMGRDAGISLFVLLTGLKLLELRSYRDAMVLLYLGYFLVITNVVFSQSVPMAGFILIAALALLSVQLAMHRDGLQAPQWRQLLRQSGTLLVQAAPLVLVLFVLFPRLNGPIWGLSKDAYSGMTGLSDRMAPGNISSLAQSDEVAFRVRFDGPLPDDNQLYWRGPVLGSFDGRAWAIRQNPHNPGPQIVEASDPVSYTITLEPHNRDWLLALETLVERPRYGFLSINRVLIAPGQVRERKQYRVTSWLNTAQSGLDPDDRRETLALPGDENPEARALGESWRTLPERQRIQKALDRFVAQPFFYTLQPPLLADDGVDQFLFDTRRGFCEHYAGAFTFLMRAAGLPARVVTGYQGGDFNPVGDYLLVRQRNAHAWSEVWLQDQGWTRVDPTAVIPAGRVELPEENLRSRASLSERLGIGAPGFIGRGLRALSRTADAVNNRWNEWILAYGGQQQKQFLRNLGLGELSATSIGLTLVGSVLALLMLMAAWMFWRHRPKDPVVAAYDRYCRRLARRGVVRAAAEGPWDFYHRLAAARPEDAGQAKFITVLYTTLRYQPGRDPQHLQQLQRSVNRFHP